MRAMVQTEKHIFQQSLATVAGGAITNISIATAVDVATGTGQVRQGSRISAIYIELWITGDDAVQGTAIITLEKRMGGQAAMTVANSAALNAYLNKKNVLHTFQGLTPPNSQYPMAAIKGWFKIPKSKQRFGLGDRIVLNVHGQSDGVNFCGFYIFKEQF